MELKRLASILYDMSCDMDCGDYVEHAEKDLDVLELELGILKSLNCKCLLQVLSSIAEEHEGVELLGR